MIYTTYYESPIGKLLLAEKENKLIGLWIEGQKYYLDKLNEDIKEKMSAQAVGGAVGHNPISIIIPCHRVIGANGNLTGYAGGIDKKIELLKFEKVDTKLFHNFGA